MLGGGIPRGSISEVAGAFSTGKTSFALSTIAAITQSGAACAWVDVSDALSPESAAAANIVLKRLLWLRMSAERKQRVTDKPWSRLEQALKATDLLLQAGGFAAIVLDMSDVLPQARDADSVVNVVSLSACRRAGPHCACSSHTNSMRQQLRRACFALEPASVRPFSSDGETALFEGQRYTLVRERNRNEGSAFHQKKPSMRAEWPAETLVVEGAVMYAVLHPPNFAAQVAAQQRPELRKTCLCAGRWRATGRGRDCGEQGSAFVWRRSRNDAAASRDDPRSRRRAPCAGG